MVLSTKGSDVYDGTLNSSTVMVLVCSPLAIAGGLELMFLIFYSFKRYQGLYFWSLTAASLALIPYAVCFVVMYFRAANGAKLAAAIINNLAWIVMVLGQSLVLYSRLHLVLDNPRLLRLVLWGILVTTSIFYVATTAIQFGSYTTRDFDPYLSASKVVEKIQMTGFSCQEFALAYLYIRQVLKIQRVTAQGNARRVMWQLFLVNALIIALDLALLVMEYIGLLVFQQIFKSAAYAIKLKMEFAVLGKLIDMVQPTGNRWPYHDVDLNVFPSQSPSQGRRTTFGSVHVEASPKMTA